MLHKSHFACFRRAILTNPDLLPSTPWSRLLEDDFWGTPLTDSGSHGSYRPLCVLTFRLNYLLGGFQPWGYHLVNVLLHCLATALLVKVARQVFPKTRTSVGPAVTGLVFATHPIHTEAVAGVVGRADLAACNLYLLAFLCYIAHVKHRDTMCCKQVIMLDDKLRHYRAKCHRLLLELQANWPRKILHTPPATTKLSKLDLDADDSACCWTNRCKAWGLLTLSIVLAVAAMLSKETGVTVLGVCAVFDLVRSSCVNKVSFQLGAFEFVFAMHN